MKKLPVSSERRKLIAKIQIAKKDLGLDKDDATYRDMLFNLTGRDSCTELSDRQLVLVIGRLRAMGWNPVFEQAGKTKAGRLDGKPKVASGLEALRDKIAALLVDMDKDWAYANGILSRMFNIPGMSWADRRELTACIAALTKQQTRQKAQDAASAKPEGAAQ